MSRLEHLQTSRRHFLRGTGALIALPALESLGFRRLASAAPITTGVPPKRCVFMGIGFGVTKETWFPDATRTGSDYKLSEGLTPLARHQSDITKCKAAQINSPTKLTGAAPSG
ncbi:MAG: DUF1552 domain-containing protein [Rubripirellula sp.]